MGPLLLIIYINDTYNVNTPTKIIAYYDDISIFLACKDADDNIRVANNILLSIKACMDCEKLIINHEETKPVFVSFI